MAYGLSFEEVNKVTHPRKVETGHGHRIDAISEPEFSLQQFHFKNDASFKLPKTGGFLFVEAGKLICRSDKHISLVDGDVLEIPKNLDITLNSKKETLAYFFSGQSGIKKLKAKRTFDIRDKYWGRVESIFSENFTGKRIFMKAETQSSLEYHSHKKEAYVLQSGKLKVGLRIGRAENRSVILSPGDIYVIRPGLMHMRIALEDSVIIEVSTKDDDRDSHLVEDGRTYVHQETGSLNP
ncbi:MAG: hypothetical protein ABIB47_06660 [Candidatus Woesearchaeota archaeon]